MPNYELYDKIVSETLSLMIETCSEKSGAIVNNYVDDNYTHYFIEVAKMASHLCGCPLYIRASIFKFLMYRLKYWKTSKRIKRYSPKKYDENFGFISLFNISFKIRQKFQLPDNQIFEQIYEEYYKRK